MIKINKKYLFLFIIIILKPILYFSSNYLFKATYEDLFPIVSIISGVFFVIFFLFSQFKKTKHFYFYYILVLLSSFVLIYSFIEIQIPFYMISKIIHIRMELISHFLLLFLSIPIYIGNRKLKYLLNNNQMKKILFLFAIPIVILLIIFFYLNTERKINIYEEYIVQSNEELIDIPWWFIITSEENRGNYSEEMALDVPKIDFSKHYLLHSRGRKIEKLSYRLLTKKWFTGIPTGIPKFGTEFYPNSEIYYKIARIKVVFNMNRVLKDYKKNIINTEDLNKKEKLK